MVFESVLVDILNRFLSPYVKNLDASQIQVSVWSGNVQLDNLELKENALEQFNIPVRVHFGYLDKFRAKIPWKNLYNEPTIVEIDGLYIVAGPNSAFKFDPVKAMEEARNKKLQELEKFKRIKKNKKQKKEKQEEAQDQTFAEKVITQVIKNLQVTIKNIHIRYEDTHTIPRHMFAAGVSLSQLIMHSVDGNWQLGASNSDPNSRLIYKLFDLQCLALYWNVESESYYKRYKKKEELLKVLRGDIADAAKQPTHLQFILMPVSANAKVQLDTKCGQDLTTPQALVNLQVEELSLSVSTQQYRQALSLLEEFDRLGRNKPYAKFRPEVPLANHSKEWWSYAYKSVLSEIQPKLQEFSWEHIKHHRELCKRYIAKFQKKLLSATSNPERSKTLALLEQELDVFNILLCREIAEERAAKVKKQKKEQSKSTWSSWLGWDKSKSKSRDDDVIIGDINLGSAGQLDEEKKKFYTAIGYTEGNLPDQMSACPREYVALKLFFVMNRLIVNLRDHNDGIAKLTTDTFKADATYRPSAKGLAFHTEFSHVKVSGCRRGTHRPIILQNTKPIQTRVRQNTPLFALDFEMNPLNSKLDFKIGASLQPIEVVYDAKTIDSIIGMFIIPPETHLFDLRKAALATVEDIRTMSRSGLQFAIENRTLVEIKVDIQAPYFIIPEKGEYFPDKHKIMILDLGSLHISSDTQEVLSLDVNQATQQQLESAFYDKFNVRLENLQALVAAPGQDWMNARIRKDDLRLHLIKPTGFELSVSKSLIPNDTRLPNLRVDGTINALHFTLSDRKIQSLTEIVLSLPLPPPSIVNHATQVAKMGPAIVPTNAPREAEFNNLFENLNLQSADKFILPEDDEESTSDYFETTSLDTSSDTASFTTSNSSDPSETLDQSLLPTYIKLLADIKIERIGILITKQEHDREIPQLLLELSNGVIHLKQRTWDLILNSELGELKMLDLTTIKPGTDNESLALLESEADNRVFSLQLCIAERESPEYHTLFNSTNKTVRVTTYPMHFALHKNSLFNVTTLLVSLLPSVEKAKSSPLATQAILSVDQIDEAVEGKLGYKPTFWGRENEKGLHLDITMHPATLTLYDYTGPFIRAEFLGIQASITLQRLRMDLELVIQGYLISDLNPQTFYPILLDKVDPNVPFLRLKMNVFKEATLKDKYLHLEQKDLYIELKLGRIRLILLAPLIAKVVPFFTQLARIDFSQKALIDTAKDTAAVTAKETAVAAKSQSSSRIALNVMVEAPSILIPFDNVSRDVFIIDVGNFDAINSFLFASELYGSHEDPNDKWIDCHGLPTVVDKMQVTFSDLQINRSKSYYIPEINSKDTNQRFPILQPVNFILFLNRALTSCKTEIPRNQMTVKIDIISIHIKPQDLVFLSSVLTSLRLVQASLEVVNARQQVNSRQPQASPTIETQPSKEIDVPTPTDGISINALLDTVKITVYSDEDSFADIFLTHFCIDAAVIPPVSKLRAVIRGFGVRDLSPNSIYPEILTTSTTTSNNFIMLELESCQDATKGDNFFDTSQADGKINLTVGKIRCYLIYTFINHILHTLLQFKVSRKTVNALKKQAKKQAATTATSTVEKIAQSETKRMLLAVKIEAPVIVIPVSADSSEGLVIDLGVITVNNAFSLEKPRFCLNKDFDFSLELSRKMIFDKINLAVSSIQLYRQISQDLSVTKCDPILQSFELNLSIIRTIPFNSEEKSQAMICVSLSSILMEFHLNDYKTILSIIQSNFNSNKVLEIPIDDSEFDPEEEIEEDTSDVDESKPPKKISLPNLAFFLHLDGYILSIIARDEEITKLILKSLDLELSSTSQKLTFSGELGEFLLTQPCNATLYSKIICLSPESQQVIRFNLTYTPNLSHDPTSALFNNEYDIDLNLEVGEIEVVILYSYISKMVNFATNFSPKRSQNPEPEKPKEGAIPPDERLLNSIASLDNLVKMKERAKIVIQFKAPRIYIPQNSNSNQVIIADLGNITLKTEPTLKKIPDANQEILSDNYQLILFNLAISRAFININEDKNIESIISIRPLTSKFCLELSLTRRITLSQKVPFLLFDVHFHEISLLLGSLDIEMITNLITDQIKEHDTALAYNDSDFSFSLPISPITKSSKVEPPPKQPPMLKRRDTISKPHIFKSDPDTPLLSVQIQIDSVGLKLFHKEKDIVQNLRQNVDELKLFNIPEERGFANLVIVSTSINAFVKPNLIVEMEFTLNDIVVQDVRTEKVNTINRMFSRGILSKSRNPLLAVTLKRVSNDELTIQIFFSELTIIFSTEFLITLALFFWNPIEKIRELQEPSDAKPKRKNKKQEKAHDNSAQELTQFIPTFRIILAVKNPTIFLLENTDSSNPRALVGKLELSGIVKHDRGFGFSTTFTLSEAMLYNCHYQTSHKPYSHVIAPVSAQMTMKAIPNDIQIHMIVESISINLTPSTLALISNIAESLKFPDINDFGYAPSDLWAEHMTKKHSWFLRSFESIDYWSVVSDNSVKIEDNSKVEKLDLEIQNIDIKLESEFKGEITPVLLLHAYIDAELRNWSTQLEMEAILTSEASYFNEKCSTWEPLLEPSKSRNSNNFVPLRLKADLNKSAKGSSSDVIFISDSEIQTQALQAEYAFEVTAIDGINLTVSRELIELISKYKDEFDIVKNTAVSWNTDVSTDIPQNSVYMIQNEMGIPINIALDEIDIFVFSLTVLSKAKTIEDSTPCYIYTTKPTSNMDQAILSKKGKVKDHYIHLSIENFSTIPFIPIHRTGNLFYLLAPTNYHFVVVEINLIQGRKQIIVRSPMKFRNEMDFTLEIFYTPFDSDSSHPKSLAIIEPRKTFYVPFHHAYHSVFRLAPHNLMYGPSLLGFSNESKFSPHFTECPVNLEMSTSKITEPPFYFTLDSTEDVYTREPLRFHEDLIGKYPHHIFTAHYPSILHNLLPIPLSFEVDNVGFKYDVSPGSTSNILFFRTDHPKDLIFSLNLFGFTFKGKFDRPNLNNSSACKMHSSDNHISFVLGIYAEMCGSLQIKVFAPYWILNKTGVELEYKSSESAFHDSLVHESNNIPFLFPSTTLGSKVKLAIKRTFADQVSSEWSKSIAIGAIGSENLAESQIPGTDDSIQFGIRITTSSLSFTKIVIITPYNLLINNTKQDISVQQEECEYIQLKPGDCQPFYPMGTVSKIIPDTSSEGALLDITVPGQILLHFDGANPAIAVDISTNVSSNVITFQSYYSGAVPVQIVNSLSDVMIEVKQKGFCGVSTLVLPGTYLNYTWQDPSKPHEIEWWPSKQGKKKTTASVNFDADGKTKFAYGLDVSTITDSQMKSIVVDSNSESFPEGFDDISQEASIVMSSNKSTSTPIAASLYWVSFMDGLQRILLITDDPIVAKHAKQVQNREKIDFSFSLSIEQIGISLVDAITRTEIAFITLLSSDTVWQYLKNGRIWKTLSGEVIKKIESAYKADPNTTLNQNDLKVDFQSMQMFEPYTGNLRRTHFPGVSLELQISSSQLYFDVKIASVQVDNQMAHILYPIVFHSVALPTDALNFDPKPFVEASLILLLNRKMVNSLNIRYFKVLVQEMSFNLDIGFVEGVIGLFGDLEQREWTTKELFEFDYQKVINASITDLEGSVTASQGSKHFIDYLHLSPLKINLSFSLQHGSEPVDKRLARKIVTTKAFRVLLDSLGVPGSAEKVLLQLKYLDIQHRAMTQRQIVQTFLKHYKQAGLTQIYKILLGLDVIGNPLAVIRQIGSGAKDLFYEPYQGAIEGPEAFIVGVGHGITSLAGSTVGGVAGAVSKITSTVGKGLAALSFDTRYQRSRRRQDIRARTPGEEFFRGGKSFATGLFEGVTGIVAQPVRGVAKEGAVGLVKGIGKGLIGVVARPLGGGVDLLTATFGSLQKAVSGDKVLMKRRHPRFIGEDKTLTVSYSIANTYQNIYYFTSGIL